MPKVGTDEVKPSPQRRAPKRFTSMRAARRWLEHVMRECYRGERPMSHGPQAAQVVKAWAEMYLTEKQLTRLGEDMEDAKHPLGRDGNLPPDEPGIARERKIERTSGQGPKGEIDMTTVSEEDVMPGELAELGSGSTVQERLERTESAQGDPEDEQG